MYPGNGRYKGMSVILNPERTEGPATQGLNEMRTSGFASG
jgi:hypothetical protein